MKKKLLILLLILTMAMTMFSGCGGGRTSSDDDEDTTKKTTKAAKETTEEKSKDTSGGLFGGGSNKDDNKETKGSEKTEGTELSDFVTKYTEAKQVIWDKITKQLESGTDMNATMAMLGFAFADMAIIIVPFFDTVELTGGTMMFSEVKNAYKKTNGDKITFGYDYTYAENSNSNQKGDRTFCEGLYDMGDQSMTFEMYEESDGKMTTRTVVEITENKDKSFSSQLISYTGENEKVTGYFTTFVGEDLWSRMAEKDADEKFDFNTVIGNKLATLDEMTEGFTVTMEVSYVDGKAEVITNE